MAGLDIAETGSEPSQPKFEFTSLPMSKKYVLLERGRTLEQGGSTINRITSGKMCTCEIGPEQGYFTNKYLGSYESPEYALLPGNDCVPSQNVEVTWLRPAQLRKPQNDTNFDMV